VIATGESRRAGRLVLALRALLLIAAMCALASGFVIGLRGARSARPSGVRYVCPMHPEVTSDVDGACPICRMALEPMRAVDDRPEAAVVRASSYQTYDTIRRRFYAPDVPEPAWVDEDGAVVADLYWDELPTPLADARATFISSRAVPATEVPVRASGDAPEPWDASTCHVRFRVRDDGVPPEPGQVGWLRFTDRPHGVPVLPRSAILEGADGPRVLVASADGRILTSRPVQTGRSFGGVTAVLSGVSATERVLTGDAFYVDAELRLRRASTLEVTR
jgi:hypothetical protein